MKQDEVIFRLKSIVHSNQHYTTWTVSTPHLVQLVNSAIEMEREECAKILDANAMACHTPIMRSLLQSNAQAIRARGLFTHPPQRTEQNFCPRCGKRTKDIHTCTPPRENT